jgi:hypothetical protein
MGMKARVLPYYVILYDVFDKKKFYQTYIYKQVLWCLPMLYFLFYVMCFIHMIYVSNVYLCEIY